MKIALNMVQKTASKSRTVDHCRLPVWGPLLSRNPMPPITCIASDVMASVAGWPCASRTRKGLVYGVVPEERNKLATIRDVVAGACP